MPHLLRRTFGVFLILLSGSSALAGTIRPTGRSVAGEVLIKIREGASASDIANIEKLADADKVKRLSKVKAGTLWRVHSRSRSAEALAAALQHNPNIEYVEPNFIVRLVASPNDTSYGQLWGLRNSGQSIGGGPGSAGADIDAEAAWNVTTGSKNVVVGVVDTGIDYTHPDLAANMWTNPGGKGDPDCAAGTFGFNAITGTCDPKDDHNHGTHVAGTIGAVGNNSLGVAGVNWAVSLMGLKFLAADGYGTTADAIAAIDFAVQAKIDGVNIRVLSNSWGGGPFSKALFDEINKANEHDILFVAAAGNDGSSNDTYAHYPSNYPTPNMISVAATDNRDALAWFSNFGPTTVHLAAPGVSVLSTVIGGSYSYYSGTSMATPHVAGVAALVLAQTPSLTTAQVKDAILNNTDPIPSVAGITTTGGRLNAAKALGAPASPEFTMTVSPTSRSVVRGGSASYTVTITPVNGFSGTVNLSASNLPFGTTATFTPSSTATSSQLVITTTSNTPIFSTQFTITGTGGGLTRNAFAGLSITATPQAAPCPSFTASGFSFSDTTAAAMGDFNRDGRRDLALVETTLNRITVRLGSTFSSAISYPVGKTPVFVAVGDFNGDGKQDLATANSAGNNVSVLLGNGDGTFQSAVHHGAGTNPFSVAAGDFNRDGRTDLAVANNGGGNVSVLLGQGDGTFASAVHYPAGSGPFWVTVADVDADGRLDLAVANFNSDTVSLLRGNGDGTFAAPGDSAAGDGPSSVAVADLDGDGKLDLAVSNHNSSNVSILTGNGNGTFDAAVNLPVGDNPYSVAAGDFNGDGRPDLVTAENGSRTISVLMATGNGAFQSPIELDGGDSTEQAIVGDVTGDGKPDIVVVNSFSYYYYAVLLYRNVGTCAVNCGTFTGTLQPGTGTSPESIAAGDFNADGRTDLAIVNNGSSSVSIWLGTGNGTFTAGVTLSAGSSSHGIATGDFNRDGRLDLAVGSPGSNAVAILLGNGDATFQSAATFATATNPRAVAAGDFDRDGKLDLAVPARNLHAISILRGNGDGTFQAPVDYSTGNHPESVAVGDFNRDGVLDLAVANSASSNVSILLGNANGTFGTATNYGAGTTAYSVIAEDLNADGKLDLAVANAGAAYVSVLTGNGNGTFAAAVNHATDFAPYAVVAADLNADGRLDLATANYGVNTVSVLFASDGGGFAAAVAARAGSEPASIAAGDFNADGKPDLAVANRAWASVSVLMNSCPIPDLTVTKSHSGTFTQGDTGRTYTITVTNAGGVATSGTVTVTDSLPNGLSATSIAGSGWTCTVSPLSCTRNDALAAGASYPAITLTVKVAGSAPASVTNTVTVAGGGELNALNNSASDPTVIVPATDVSISKTHVGSFTQGATGRSYTILVRNLGGLATSGTVTVTDTLPSALTATAIGGTGWSCTLGNLTCTRSDALAGGSNYPPIIITVDVAANAPPLVTNTATVSGGGDANLSNNTATDATAIWGSGTCGSFAAPVYYPGSYYYASGLAMADFNGDGVQDAALPNYSFSGAVAVLLGNANGTFSAPTDYAAGVYPRRVAAGDLDNDGDADLVVTGETSSVQVLRGNGNGTFAAAVSYPAGNSYSYGVALGDLNGDGNLDVALANSGPVVHVLLGNGDGTLQTVRSFSTIGSPASVTIGDVDRDGLADLAVPIYSGIAILRGNGDGTFKTAVELDTYDWPNSVAIGDFNGDGNPDLAASSYYAYGTFVLLGTGNGAFAQPVFYSTAYGASHVATGDVNGDGAVDLIVANSGSDNIATLLGNGNGTFQSASRFTAFSPSQLVVGDFNADGKADIAFNNYYSGRLGIALGGCPDVTITKTHTGNFRAGQTGAQYQLNVSVTGASPIGVVTVKDILPEGLTATHIGGSGWSCTLSTLTCTRTEPMNTGQTYSIFVTVNVSLTAPTSVTNVATVSGGGDSNANNNSASDPTTIVYAADLTVTKSHIGNFSAGQNGVYTINVGNVGTGPTSGTVTVADTLPAGMAAVSMSGTGWDCNVNTITCTRTDALGGTSAYPPITLTVAVNNVSQPVVTNWVTVSGGGDSSTANNTDGDETYVTVAPPNVTAIALSTTTINVTWTNMPGASTYEVLRSTTSSGYAVISTTITNNFLDRSVTPNTTYLYKVRAVSGGVVGPLSAPDLATTVMFTDDPIVARTTVIKAVHIQELRTAINAVRAAAGLGPVTLTDGGLTSGFLIRPAHITELRSAVSAARSILGVPAISYADPSVPTGMFVKAAHITDLRTSVK